MSTRKEGRVLRGEKLNLSAAIECKRESPFVRARQVALLRRAVPLCMRCGIGSFRQKWSELPHSPLPPLVPLLPRAA